jgi:uncharacterized surface protein with fasciclin (FAS1) repeats
LSVKADDYTYSNYRHLHLHESSFLWYELTSLRRSAVPMILQNMPDKSLFIPVAINKTNCGFLPATRQGCFNALSHWLYSYYKTDRNTYFLSMSSTNTHVSQEIAFDSPLHQQVVQSGQCNELLRAQVEVHTNPVGVLEYDFLVDTASKYNVLTSPLVVEEEFSLSTQVDALLGLIHASAEPQMNYPQITALQYIFAHPQMTKLTQLIEATCFCDEERLRRQRRECKLASICLILDQAVFTMFAPVDSAFASVTEDAFQWLLESPQAAAYVISYHILGPLTRTDECKRHHRDRDEIPQRRLESGSESSSIDINKLVNRRLKAYKTSSSTSTKNGRLLQGDGERHHRSEIEYDDYLLYTTVDLPFVPFPNWEYHEQLGDLIRVNQTITVETFAPLVSCGYDNDSYVPQGCLFPPQSEYFIPQDRYLERNFTHDFNFFTPAQLTLSYCNSNNHRVLNSGTPTPSSICIAQTDTLCRISNTCNVAHTIQPWVDQETLNGLIHKIDRVLMPPNILLALWMEKIKPYNDSPDPTAWTCDRNCIYRDYDFCSVIEALEHCHHHRHREEPPL